MGMLNMGKYTYLHTLFIILLNLFLSFLERKQKGKLVVFAFREKDGIDWSKFSVFILSLSVLFSLSNHYV